MKALATAAALLAAAAAAGAETRLQQVDRIDRIVAIVDEDPILGSDIDRAVALGLVTGDAAGSDEPGAVRRAVLDRLIEERLRFHEIDRFGFTEISLEEVDRAYEQIRDRFASEEEFAARLAELGLDPEGLRQLVARQILVVTYVEERLGSRVFVSLDDIRRYYEETLVPEMKARGEAAPPLPEVRERIREVLKQRRLNKELDRWTEELRLEADIDDFFDEPLDELPAHLLETIEPEAG